MRLPRFCIGLLAVLASAPVSAAEGQDARTFLAANFLCSNDHPLPNLEPSRDTYFHEVKSLREERHQACATVVDAPLLPGDRPHARQKCETHSLVGYTIMCRGGAVSAARLWAAGEGQRRGHLIEGDSLLLPLQGDSGWGGRPSTGISGMRLARGGVSYARMPEGLGFSLGLSTYTLSLPWAAIASGAAITVKGAVPAVLPAPTPASAWVRALATWWPWPQLVIGVLLSLYAAVAVVARALPDGARNFPTGLALLYAAAMAGLMFSPTPAAMPERALQEAKASIAAAQAQVAQAERDRATLRGLIRISNGMIEPFSKSDLDTVQRLMGTRSISAQTDTRTNPSLWAMLCLAPSLVLVLIGLVPFIRGWHYLFVPHPAGPVVAPPLRSGTLFPKARLADAILPRRGDLERHPPAYKSRNLEEKARALKDKIAADAEIADAAMRRDRARAEQIAAEAELRAALKKLPWWKRWWR